MDMVKSALKWLAINFGSRHPYLSTAWAMILAGMAWVVFFKSVASSAAEAPLTPPNITQRASDPKCGNIVVTGGTATCEVGKEKPSEPNKSTDRRPPESSH
jgi:hypothetical protein